MAEYKGKKVTLNKPRAIRQGEPGYGKKRKIGRASCRERVQISVVAGTLKKKKRKKKKNKEIERHDCNRKDKTQQYDQKQ